MSSKEMVLSQKEQHKLLITPIKFDSLTQSL